MPNYCQLGKNFLQNLAYLKAFNVKCLKPVQFLMNLKHHFNSN